MKREVVNHLSWIVSQLAKIYVYEPVSQDPELIHLRDSFNRFYTSLINGKWIDLENLTTDEAHELRFGKWDEDSNLYLFPLWLVPIIPDGMTVYSLDEKPFIYKASEADNDIRYGCVAYGLMLED